MKAVIEVNNSTAISKWPSPYCNYKLFLATNGFRKPQGLHCNISPTSPQKYFAPDATRSYLLSAAVISGTESLISS
jgi:hypothetical protein